MKVTDDRTKTWKAELTCRDCKSVLEIEAGDVVIGEFGGNYAEHGDLKPYVTCPVCKADNAVPVPGWVRRQAEERSKKP